ncbi:sugar O-acyltransferase, sialic acid O-acetyltransferase NeuD family [Pseudooceanicola nitratireducens]|uniref:Sugar O-acyltransferase, sialic acid O-acetyltransferase NeuD family n=1 Tax=Pseudooceanicola nitratireducens TaxID=517719 RepID=A0A1I1Q9V9_9RHOB|nr:NeuD/PglB/VioB family sugar acetyltransferase [Pseudooceanicola nitratireducens]SEJ73458.1 sugar O-acyltransferase, sialic acid O-acetyltransferase NeuD family [Pseudooceanicola nitratireducens]SFD18924.1 sugar O-acyltransferase, sialic acid O-acetyltransferase NeuD family [Pseudooceanicola nitratireducens]
MTCVIIGSGGHAKVVLAALRAGGSDDRIELRDGNPERAGLIVAGLKVRVPDLPEGSMTGCRVHVAIGHNATRLALLDQALTSGAEPLSVLHPRSHVDPSASIGPGSLCAALAIVGPDAAIGRAAIVNHAAVVDHDCRIGDGVHIAPGAVLGGGVRVGNTVLIGANATILPGLEIGDNAVIGAGAIVTKSVSANQTWIGTQPVQGRS